METTKSTTVDGMATEANSQNGVQAWAASDSTAPWSVRWCSEHLGIDINDLRRRMTRRSGR